MNDYSFGNYISTLRMRCGLSQYQLGVLVGVTDKAVSKWENGAAKPGIIRCQMLANVLGVTLDELLSCEYNSLHKNRKDLFAMKNEIWKSAQEKIHEIYGEDIPLRIVNRFEYEKMNIGDHNMLIWYDFFGKLRDRLHTEGEELTMRSASVSSFIAWILGATSVNPLPSHYYCPVCKKVEFVSEYEDGYDLPLKYCQCGTKLIGDGHCISAGNLFPLRDPSFEILISKKMENIAVDFLKEYFKENAGVIEIIFEDSEINKKQMEPSDTDIRHYAIIEKSEMQKYTGGIYKTTYRNYFEKDKFNQSIDFVMDNKVRKQQALNYHGYQEIPIRKYKEILKRDIESNREDYPDAIVSFEKYVDSLGSISFYELLKLTGLLHGTGTWTDNAERLLEAGRTIKDVICFREEVFDYMNEKISMHCGESSDGLAFQIRENVRKGKYHARGIPSEVKKILKQCQIPEWYVESMGKIWYLMPKYYIVDMLTSV